MNKQELLSCLRDVLERWEMTLAGMTEEDIAAARVGAGWSAKDIVAHVRAWQQITIARIEAAANDSTPVLPSWLEGADPSFAEDHVDEFNARIHAHTRDEPWPSVHATWRDGFLRLLALAEAIPEAEMFDAQRYPWLRPAALAAVLQGSCEHHQGHLSTLLRRGVR